VAGAGGAGGGGGGGAFTCGVGFLPCKVIYSISSSENYCLRFLGFAELGGGVGGGTSLVCFGYFLGFCSSDFGGAGCCGFCLEGYSLS